MKDRYKVKASPGLEATRPRASSQHLHCVTQVQGNQAIPDLQGYQAYTWFTYTQAGKIAIHIKLYIFFIYCWKSPTSPYLKVTREHGLLTTTQVSNFKKAYRSLTRTMLSSSQGLSLLKRLPQRVPASDIFLHFTVRSSHLSVH